MAARRASARPRSSSGKAFGATVVRHRRLAGEMRGLPQARRRSRRSIIREEDFVAVVKEATGGKGVPLIIDMVGGDYIGRNYDGRRDRGGRIVQIAFLKGRQGRGRFPPPDGQAPAPYRLDPPSALRGTEGGDRPFPARQGGPSARRGTLASRSSIPPSSWPMVAKAHARMDSSAQYRQDRADRWQTEFTGYRGGGHESAVHPA